MRLTYLKVLVKSNLPSRRSKNVKNWKWCNAPGVMGRRLRHVASSGRRAHVVVAVEAICSPDTISIRRWEVQVTYLVGITPRVSPTCLSKVEFVDQGKVRVDVDGGEGDVENAQHDCLLDLLISGQCCIWHFADQFHHWSQLRTGDTLKPYLNLFALSIRFQQSTIMMKYTCTAGRSIDQCRRCPHSRIVSPHGSCVLWMRLG